MKNQFRVSLFLLTFVLLILSLFSSCSDIFTSDSNDGRGKVSLRFKMNGNSARLIEDSASETDNPESYRLVAKLADKKPQVKEFFFTEKQEVIVDFDGLTIGSTVQVQLYVYQKDVLVYAGKSEKIKIGPGTNTAAISLHYLDLFVSENGSDDDDDDDDESSGDSSSSSASSGTYTLILNANSGIFSDGSTSQTITATGYANFVREMHSKKNSLIPTCSDYAFRGWSKSSTTDGQADSLMNFVYFRNESEPYTINALWENVSTETSKFPVSWFVSGDQANSTWCSTIQDAVNQVITANDGTTSYVIWFDKSLIDSSESEYSADNNQAYCSIVPNKPLNLDITAASGGALQKQMVKANGKGRVFYIGSNANVTISNGLAADNGNAEKGGGFYVANGGKLTFKSGSFCMNCEATTTGSEDIYVENGGILYFAQWNGERVYLESDAMLWLGEYAQSSVVTLPSYGTKTTWLKFFDNDGAELTDSEKISGIVRQIIPANESFEFDSSGKLIKKE